MKRNRTLSCFARFISPEATLFICCKAKEESASGEQKEILDSIHYAKRIQQALMPSDKRIDKILKDKNK